MSRKPADFLGPTLRINHIELLVVKLKGENLHCGMTQLFLTGKSEVFDSFCHLSSCDVHKYIYNIMQDQHSHPKYGTLIKIHIHVKVN